MGTMPASFMKNMKVYGTKVCLNLDMPIEANSWLSWWAV